MQNIGSARNQRPVIIFPLNYALCFFGSNGGGFSFSSYKTRKRNSRYVSRFSTARPFHLQAHQSPASFFQRVSVTYGSAYAVTNPHHGFSFPFLPQAFRFCCATFYYHISCTQHRGNSEKSNACLTFFSCIIVTMFWFEKCVLPGISG